MYFGKEVVNRVSFLRERPDFVSVSINHPSARFVFFKDSLPLVNSRLKEKLLIATNGDAMLVGEEKVSRGLKNLDLWGQTLSQWTKDNADHHHELRKDKPTFLFLGLEDESVGADLSNQEHLTYDNKYRGIPFFAVDLTKSPTLEKAVVDFFTGAFPADADKIFFATSRKHHLGFTPFEAALFSHGKMYLDWLERNQFCPGCGSRVIPIHAGGKLLCTNGTTVGEKANGSPQYECPVRNAPVSNVSFPRTDAVIITAVTDVDRTKMLLSLNKRFLITNMYTCTSGFMEPSETVEVATKREIWEETGVKSSFVDLVMTQPWPFPGNLMIGCIAEVEFNGENEVIHLGHDNELADARWFDMDFVKLLVKGQDNTENNPEGILIPMAESIAYQLIKMVVEQASERSKL